MILFRSCDHPLPKHYEGGVHWMVEYHADTGDMSFPLGTAYVTAFYQFAVIDFVFVVDLFRRQGIGMALVRACAARWPGIHLGEVYGGDAGQFAYHARRLLNRDAQWIVRPGNGPWRHPEWQ